MPKTTSTLSFKVIRSVTGSDLTFPSKMVDGMMKSLTAKWDQDIFLPPEFENDPYVRDAEAKGQVKIGEAERIPTGPKPLPDSLDSTSKGWLTQLLYGAYDERMKSFLTDWANPTFPRGANKSARITDLMDRILPLVKYAIQYEQEMRNRSDVLADLNKVEDFIENEGWKWQPNK